MLAILSMFNGIYKVHCSASWNKKSMHIFVINKGGASERAGPSESEEGHQERDGVPGIGLPRMMGDHCPGDTIDLHLISSFSTSTCCPLVASWRLHIEITNPDTLWWVFVTNRNYILLHLIWLKGANYTLILEKRSSQVCYSVQLQLVAHYLNPCNAAGSTIPPFCPWKNNINYCQSLIAQSFYNSVVIMSEVVGCWITKCLFLHLLLHRVILSMRLKRILQPAEIKPPISTVQ